MAAMAMAMATARVGGAGRARSWAAVLLAGLLVVAGAGVAPSPAAGAVVAVEVTEVVLGGEAVTVPVTAPSATSTYTRPDLSSYEGTFDASAVLDWFEITREVEGVGPVTLEVQPNSVNFASLYGGFYLPRQYASVTAGGSLAESGALELSMQVQVRTVNYGGVTTPVTCTVRNSEVATSGQVAADGIAFRVDSTLGAPTTDCGGHAAVIQAALAGPASLELWFPGEHPVASEDVASEVVVTPVAAGGTVHDRVAVDVAVTWAPDGAAIGAPGTVQVLHDGTEVSTASLGPDGTARLYVDLATAGPVEYEVVYGGRAVGDVGFPLPSSAPFVFDAEPFPAGRAVSGAVTVDGVASPMPAGAVWVGGDYDPVGGVVGPGALASPVGSVTIPDAILGSVDLVVQQRLVPVGEVGGQVRPDGTVELDPVQFQVDARSASVGGDLEECVGEPFTVELVGTADASGLHLTAEDLALGAAPPGSCAGQATNINSILGGVAVDLELHVAGDFTPPEGVETSVAVQSWFGEVAQFDQTILSAQVLDAGSDQVGAGTVVFADGGQVLATVPVVAGVANAVVGLSTSGTRVITATYSGAGGFGPSSSSVAVVVTPAPGGGVVAGGLAIAGREVAPGAAGVVVGPLGAGGSTSWAPVVLDGDVGGGSSAAEVRLIQVGAFTGDATDVQATFWLQVRSVSSGGVTVNPLGCVSVVTVDFAADGSGGLVVAAGSSVRMATGWCRHPLASAWTDALTGPVTGSLAPAP
jgi:hypothetical protein